MEKIGELLRNTETIPATKLSDRRLFCDCGVEIEPMGEPPFQHIPKKCNMCREAEKLEKERLKQERRRLEPLLELRKKRERKRDNLRAGMENHIPARFRTAHIYRISKNLKEIFQKLPMGRGIMLYGSPGVGKTYAMAAFMRYLITGGCSVERVVYDDLCREIRDTFKANSKTSEGEILKRLCGVDKLFIEDVGTTVGDTSQETDFSLRLFNSILDKRGEDMKATFITSNKSPEVLGKTFDARVESRLYQACETIAVGGRDKRRST